MSSQLRFEGNDLETLLQRVRAEVGDEARIIAANRLRKGGIGGFFAKELYEVIVEPPPGAPANAPDPVGAVRSVIVACADQLFRARPLEQHAGIYERLRCFWIEERSPANVLRDGGECLETG